MKTMSEYEPVTYSLQGSIRDSVYRDYIHHLEGSFWLAMYYPLSESTGLYQLSISYISSAVLELALEDEDNE
jgi:hypothetical protein